MKYRAWNSTLPAPTKRMERKTSLRNRGGRMFPQSPADQAYWDALGLLVRRLLPCDGCGRWTLLSRCHVLARSKGGRDLDNIALLCGHEWAHTDIGSVKVAGCHELSEKKPEKFMADTGKDLYAIARERTARHERLGGDIERMYEEETERG